MGNFRMSKRSYERLNGIDAILIAIITEAIKKSPYDFGIPKTGGLRTCETQQELYKKGVSKADGIIKKSYHQTGKAFDVYGYVGGKATWNPDIMKAIANHIMKVAKKNFKTTLTWGGNWKSFRDYPHFQI